MRGIAAFVSGFASGFAGGQEVRKQKDEAAERKKEREEDRAWRADMAQRSRGMPDPGMSSAAARLPNGEMASLIRRELMSDSEGFALPDYVADAALLNFQDESGLNPGINEAKPLVAGSRGGYGLYQLTGPRRVAFEQAAAADGAALDDPLYQARYFKRELLGPEKAAAAKILAAMPATKYTGVIGTTTFDSKGDLQHGVISLYNYKSGKKTLLDEVKM